MNFVLTCGFLAMAGAVAIDKKKAHPYVVVCYLGSWANYRRGEGKFRVEDIDPTLCTHLVYGFAKLGHDNRIAAYDSYLDLKEHWGLGAYDRFTGLKSGHPQLKTLLAIGGWNEGSTKYSRMARRETSRSVFVRSCVETLLKHGFDGLDMDWEYPATRGGVPQDKGNFVKLLKELHEAFQPHNLLLTSAVSAGQHTIDVAYDIPALGKYLDLINLMAYDFHGGWDKTTGHNSPMYARLDETGTQRTLNVDYAVKYWLRRGAPASKLVLGMPLYGRSFVLQDPHRNGYNATIRGKGKAGEYTREQGFMGYNELCKMFQKDKTWKVTIDKHVQAPHAVKDRNWIGYDDIKSLSLKVDYLMKMKLAGAMVWSLETDDFHGKCHGYRFPLLQSINAVLNGSSIPLPDYNVDQENAVFPITPSATLQPSTSPNSTILKATRSVASTDSFHMPNSTIETSRTTPTLLNRRSETTPTLLNRSSETTHTLLATTDNPKDHPFDCPHYGYFRHPKNCRYFYVCQAAPPEFESAYLVHLFACSVGTVYSRELRICAYSTDVPECRDA
ncbi:hypothetical protein JTE90_009138 [Oedothorax gibbosus]|uniref:chitinase n=1 Tax=Oedothorax gibbosus TaxID=931172 RepID=A0AAV6TUX8_9ARAC|nr:hypothetical protein JTE90_009138 [Oedothorax gibbosus]